MPTLVKKFYESDREEGIKKLQEYFRLFMENRPIEALNVFGVDINSRQGIEEIHRNYRESMMELTRRLDNQLGINKNKTLREKILECR